MSQLINLAALWYAPYAYFSNVSIPHFVVRSIDNVNFYALKEAGFRGAVFDKDNTLTRPYQHQIHPSIEERLKEARMVFPNSILIDSNSAGTRDDPEYQEARKIEEATGLPVLRHIHKKPAGGAAVAQQLGIQIKDLSYFCMFGDRTLTDIAFGNRYGMLTVLVDPFTEQGDLKAAATVRRGERNRLEARLRRGEQAPSHPLYKPDLCRNVIFYGRKVPPQLESN
ncbi:YqeG family HAD IIIA-type phosphatase [Candidatus Woesearchaeota archaeon]|nr:YqeG family HAD IIIA-type phosphatase [Candidatus Woesearchaeota archaeon]